VNNVLNKGQWLNKELLTINKEQWKMKDGRWTMVNQKFYRINAE